MTGRRWLVALLVVVVASSVVILRPHATKSAPAEASAQVPEEALNALRQGRYLRASTIMREFLAAHGDSAPGAILIAAQAEAGIGDWAAVSCSSVTSTKAAARSRAISR
jgi:hypothetical protein